MDNIKEMPNDLLAEKNVIGACLLDNEVIPIVHQILSSEDFYYKKNREIYESIISLYDQNQKIDLITVIENDRTRLGNDIEYITNLITDTITTTHSKQHAKIVKSKAIRRQYIKSAEKVLDNAYFGSYNSITDFRNDCMLELDIDIGELNRSKSNPSTTMQEYMQLFDQKYKDGDSNKIKYNMKFLDKVLGGVKREYTILSARPSVGKTTFALNIANKLINRGLKVAIFSLEMSKFDIVDKLVSINSNVPNEKVRDCWKLGDKEVDEVSRSISRIFNKHIYIFDNVYDIESIRYECRNLKNTIGLDFVIIDYLQLSDTRKKTNNTNDKVSHMSRSFKLMQMEFNCSFWVLSQLSRESAKEKNRKPILTDLRDSGSIEQDADTVIFLHDPNYQDYDTDKYSYTELNVIVAKQRLGLNDVQGNMRFNKTTQQIYDF